MFDRCRGWRQLLTRQAEGTLTLKEWGALDEHLARCSRCRRAQDADNALRKALTQNLACMSRSEAHAFDDGVLAALGVTATVQASPSPERRSSLSAISAAYWRQVAGGALAAACMTALCFLPTMRPATNVNSEERQSDRAMAARTTPPIPMDLLLRTPSPRAALLWGTPPATSTRPTVLLPETPAVPAPVKEKKTPKLDEHGELPHGLTLG